MYAIVNVAGKQVKAEAGKKMYVDLLHHSPGSELSFDEVMLLDNDGAISIGKPFIAGASVKATVVAQVKGPTIVVFKKKRRKGYAKRNGHRQQYTQIQIDSIVG